MTENRLVVGLTEILQIRFTCKKCGTALSVPPDNWKRVPYECHNCGVEWFKNGSLEEKALEQFRAVLGQLRKIEDDRFSIQLELASLR